MDPGGMRHIKVHPYRTLKRTTSSLGVGGNSTFLAENAPVEEHLSIKPYAVELPPSEVSGSVVMEHRRRYEGSRQETPRIEARSITNITYDADGQRSETDSDLSVEGTSRMTKITRSAFSKPPVVATAKATEEARAGSAGDELIEKCVDERPSGATACTETGYVVRLLVAYWRNVAKGGEINLHINEPTQDDIKERVERILLDTEVEAKDKLYQEVKYIIRHFKQRRCKCFCKEEKRLISLLKKLGVKVSQSRERCACGLPKKYHSQQASDHTANQWDKKKHTELVYPHTFGNLDFPGHYNYLETPGGTRKYIRLDDLETEPVHIWELFTKHWDLKPPNLVITVTGGDVKGIHSNSSLQKSFIEGILKSSVTTKAWIITDGFHTGASREISTILQEHLQRSQWSENEDHASIPLIGFTPWGLIADRKHLEGINVGMDEAIYLYTYSEKHTHVSAMPNALDPNHVIYLLPDDGTTGIYNNEPLIRREFEKYIRAHTSLPLIGAKDVHTPVVILVLGGDQFTLEKLADCTSKKNQISVVIVNDSGPVADMLAETYQKLEKEKHRSYMFSDGSQEGRYGWSEAEDGIMNTLIPKFKGGGLLTKPEDEQYLRDIMKARHLIEVFGVSEKDTKDLDKAILEATFGGTRDIVVQLNLTLAMDRCDIASSCIFTESRKQELRKVSETLQEVLLVAMETGRTKFVELLLDQDYGGELEFQKLLTVQRLHKLHSSNLDPSSVMGKVLRSMCKRENNGAYLLDRHQLLPQIGRIIYKLMGDNYRLLYQEREYRQVSNDVIPLKLTQYEKEEPVWHLLLWACLANQKEMAELFLFETSCKIGAALIAFEMFCELSKQAAILSETEVSDELAETSDYFQTLAMKILDNLYSFDRDEAYASITAVIPFRLSNYASPLHIAEDTEAMRFMGHASCQTLLNRIWYKYMDLDTKAWRLFPLFLFFPINLLGIVFDKENLSYGTYRNGYNQSKTHNRLTAVQYPATRNRNISENTRYENRAFGSTAGELGWSSDHVRIVEKDHSHLTKEHAGQKVLFRVVNYYTSPVNKFVMYFLSWLIFIGLFTYFLLDELKPVKEVKDVTVSEWIVLTWVVCISLDEVKQLIFTKSSGPLHNLSWQDIRKDWADTWYIHERLFFLLRLYKVTNWIEDGWNKIDLVMIICFWASVICRFLISPADFTIVRIMFSITIIFFYYRILRISYIMKNIGPRVITIHAMMKDLANFMLVLAIILVSFGVAFQAILNPNQPASVGVLVDVMWRPYWQMFGELFIEDATTGMGRFRSDQVVCTYNRTLANELPELHPYCYHWMAPVLLGVFMLFTNILLLNLLIAIFSHSFEKIEKEAQTIWRYHLYDLVHEYYHQVWLPPPLNVLCYVLNILIWLSCWPRKWAYKAARARILKSMNQDKDSHVPQGPDIHFLDNKSEKRIDEELKKQCCYRFYYTDEKEEEVTHFCQPEMMRNDDLEEKAYKRYLRSATKEKERNIREMLKLQSEKLKEISGIVENFGKNDILSSDHLNELNRSMTSGYGVSNTSLAKKMNSMDSKLQILDQKLEMIIQGVNQSLPHRIQSNISGIADHSR